MNIKSSKLLAVILILVVSALALTGCGKSGNRFANVLPTIEITSYEGWTDASVPANVDTLTHSYTFQQRIYWHATDTDGIITGYAFRVLDENRNPIASPGYQYISLDDGLTSQEILNKFGNGWAIHYLPGADQSIPLDNPEARRSIWTSQKYAVINFPSADPLGNPIPTMSYFEVIAIDNRGGLTELPAWRKFRTESDRPTCRVSTTKGNPDGGEVGSGLKLHFTMDDTDPFISPVPYKYEFKMMKLDPAGNVVAGSETDWISTDNEETISEYRLTRYTSPALTYDFDETSGAELSTTKILARVTDMAGVLSDVADSLALEFKVKPGFRPHTQLYTRKVLAVGDYHYEDWGDDTTPEVLPYSIVAGEQRFATPFFKNTEGMHTLVHSPSLKAYLRWGWYGEYATVTAGGSTYEYDDPYGKKVDVVLDRNTRRNYFSEITHFHLRYDGEPYNFPPFANSIHTDPDTGDRWLKVPVNSPLMQSIVLTGQQLSIGHHKFEVRCVDLQDEWDPIPAVMEFDVVPFIEPANRNGILVIDDEGNGAAPYPANDQVTQAYETIFSDHASEVTYIKRSNGNQHNTYGDSRSRHFAFSDLMKYKVVVYHQDNPDDRGSLDAESDGLTLYMKYKGNLIISHNSALSSVIDELQHANMRITLMRHLGLPDIPKLGVLSNSWIIRPFFQYADGVGDYPDVNLQYGDPPAFNALVNSRHGLAKISYFNELGTGTPIYTFGCKPVDYPNFPPTQADYNLYHGKTVGVRNVTASGGKAYTFSFPLSYMKPNQTKAMMNKILSEVL